MNILVQKNFTVDGCRLQYLKFKKKRVRKHSVRLKDSDPKARSKKYLKYAKKKTKEFTEKVNDAVQNYDPYGDIEEIEESKQTLASLQEHLDAELQRDLDGFTAASISQSGKVQNEISGLLQVSKAKIDTALHEGDEFDTQVQLEIDELELAETARGAGDLKFALDGSIVAEVQSIVDSLVESSENVLRDSNKFLQRLAQVLPVTVLDLHSLTHTVEVEQLSSTLLKIESGLHPDQVSRKTSDQKTRLLCQEVRKLCLEIRSKLM